MGIPADNANEWERVFHEIAHDTGVAETREGETVDGDGLDMLGWLAEGAEESWVGRTSTRDQPGHEGSQIYPDPGIAEDSSLNAEHPQWQASGVIGLSSRDEWMGCHGGLGGSGERERSPAADSAVPSSGIGSVQGYSDRFGRVSWAANVPSHLSHNGRHPPVPMPYDCETSGYHNHLAPGHVDPAGEIPFGAVDNNGWASSPHGWKNTGKIRKESGMRTGSFEFFAGNEGGSLGMFTKSMGASVNPMSPRDWLENHHKPTRLQRPVPAVDIASPTPNPTPYLTSLSQSPTATAVLLSKGIKRKPDEAIILFQAVLNCKITIPWARMAVCEAGLSGYRLWEGMKTRRAEKKAANVDPALTKRMTVSLVP